MRKNLYKLLICFTLVLSILVSYNIFKDKTVKVADNENLLDENTVAFYVDGTLQSSLSSMYKYDLLSYSCNNNESVTWDSDNYSVSITPLTKKSKCTLYFEEKELETPVKSYQCSNGSSGSSPYVIKYTGDCTVLDDNNGNWRVKFLSSGQLTVSYPMSIDAFLVGGGGSGATRNASSGPYAAGGGGGGYTTTLSSIQVSPGNTYEIVIGAGGVAQSTSATAGNNGNPSTAFGATAAGGKGGGLNNDGSTSLGRGGNGGSGGAGYGSGVVGGTGGSDGNDGAVSSANGGIGQGFTTREFGESTGELYAGGGGGGTFNLDSVGQGGSGGGGKGGYSSVSATAGGTNTGGGGGGAYKNSSGAGGSGIVIIRNSKKMQINNKVIGTYTGVFVVEGNTEDNYKVKFLTSGKFTPNSDMIIDAFLVGGGGSGAKGSQTGPYTAGGGGGGYTHTQSYLSLTSGQSYNIVIGSGGARQESHATPGNNGTATTGFGFTANGGMGGGKNTDGTTSLSRGGNGGSGGGGYGSGTTGGTGGSDGYNGANSTGHGGLGQGFSTREFGESSGTLYAGGGGGASFDYSTPGAGGSGGGGTGFSKSNAATGATFNTGGGGGGTNSSGLSGAGGSGIVIIRNAKPIIANNIEIGTYTGTYVLEEDGTNWKIKFLTNGTFTPSSNMNIDAFLVGGGGGGGRANQQSPYGAGGGGGGYTNTQLNFSIVKGQNYNITIGLGGERQTSHATPGNDGTASTGFGFTANGGKGGGKKTDGTTSLGRGGDGGSGGGGYGGSAVGGTGGSNGSDGGTSSGAGGTGQISAGLGTSTREFAETSGTLYAGGGGGASFNHNTPGPGGSGGGGNGYSKTSSPTDGVRNLGGGGGGANADGGIGGGGGSGIVIIRNKR